MSADIWAISISKGGCGKSTTSFNLGYALSLRGKRVLLVDSDPQGSLTIMACPTPPERGLSHVMGGAQAATVAMRHVIHPVADNLDIVAGGPLLAQTESFLHTRMGREGVLTRALDDVRDRYDVVIIDTSTIIGLLGLNALAAASNVLCPTIPFAIDLAGLRLFRETVGEVQSVVNRKLRIRGVVGTFYNGRLKTHQRAMAAVKQSGLPLCATTIGRSVRIAEAAENHQPVAQYAPDSPQGQSYTHLAEEVFPS